MAEEQVAPSAEMKSGSPFVQSPKSSRERSVDSKSRAAANPEAGSHPDHSKTISHDQLVALLNEDLAREYQAIIGYVVYSQTLKGAAYMNIANQLEIHATEELRHALIIAKQIDYLGGAPTVTAKPVKQSEKAEEMLQFDLANEIETVHHYRERVRQCETLGEFAMAEQIRQILVDEQDHQIDLATALGIDVPTNAFESPK